MQTNSALSRACRSHDDYYLGELAELITKDIISILYLSGDVIV